MKDIYGFEKVSDDVGRVANNYGFRGPGYSEQQGDPMQLSMVDPGMGVRAGRAAGHGLGGAILGGALGGYAGDRLGGSAMGDAGMRAGQYIGGALGAANGWFNAPKQLMLSPQQQAQAQGQPQGQPQAQTAGDEVEMDPTEQVGVTEGKRASHDVFGFSKEASGLSDHVGDTMEDKTPWVGALPFGSSYVGYRRGSESGRGLEGTARGFLGGTLGSAIGTPLDPLALATKAYGTHLATRGMLPQVMAQEAADKQASYDVFGFSKEAFGAPGLLSQMGSAASRMGRAAGIAGQRAGNAFQAERSMAKLTGGQLPNAGLGQSLVSAGQAGYGSLMKSQAGRRVFGTGLGLAGAGTVAAGASMIGGKPAQPVQQPAVR